jgi:hypothetical protein
LFPAKKGESQSLYQSLLGDAYWVMPPTIQALHGHTDSVIYSGRGSVARGTHWLSRMIGTLRSFPPASADMPVSVRFEIHDGTETWIRQFGAHRFHSRLSARGQTLHESFGWIGIDFRLDVGAAGLQMIPTRWAVLGISLPRLFWPTIIGQESEVDGRFQFLVEAIMPRCGLVVRYKGFLAR